MVIFFHDATFHADGSCTIRVGSNQYQDIEVERSPQGLFKCPESGCKWNDQHLNCIHVRAAIMAWESQLAGVAHENIQQANAVIAAKAHVASQAAAAEPVNDTIRLWERLTRYVKGQQIFDKNGNIQECTSSGMTGRNQPTWKLNVEDRTVSGDAIFKCVGPLSDLPAMDAEGNFDPDTVGINANANASLPTAPVPGNTYYPITWGPLASQLASPVTSASHILSAVFSKPKPAEPPPPEPEPEILEKEEPVLLLEINYQRRIRL